MVACGLKLHSGCEEAYRGEVLHGKRSMDEQGWSCGGGLRHKGGGRWTDEQGLCEVGDGI